MCSVRFGHFCFSSLVYYVIPFALLKASLWITAQSEPWTLWNQPVALFLSWLFLNFCLCSPVKSRRHLGIYWLSGRTWELHAQLFLVVIYGENMSLVISAGLVICTHEIGRDGTVWVFIFVNFLGPLWYKDMVWTLSGLQTLPAQSMSSVLGPKCCECVYSSSSRLKTPGFPLEFWWYLSYFRRYNLSTSRLGSHVAISGVALICGHWASYGQKLCFHY